MSSLSLSSAIAAPPATQESVSSVQTAPASELARLRPDSLSGHLASWIRGRSGVPTSSKATQSLRVALPAFFAQATQTAAYKNENDDATFVERLADGSIIAGVFDGVTVPSRNHRAGHAVSAFVRDQLRSGLVEKDERRPSAEAVLSAVIEDAVGVLEKLGGGAATTASVLAAVPMPTRDWRVFVINAGNSRATALLPDGTVEAITRVKPPGTPFAAVNTLSRGYTYKLEISRLTAAAGSTLLLTSDGIHDHIPDTRIWRCLGAAVEASIQQSRRMPGELMVERLARDFVVRLVEEATAAQARAQQSDDATAFALILGDPTEALLQKCS
jgi:serine/threonine protein phosphatase PrpC